MSPKTCICTQPIPVERAERKAPRGRSAPAATVRCRPGYSERLVPPSHYSIANVTVTLAEISSVPFSIGTSAVAVSIATLPPRRSLRVPRPRRSPSPDRHRRRRPWRGCLRACVRLRPRSPTLLLEPLAVLARQRRPVDLLAPALDAASSTAPARSICRIRTVTELVAV